MNNLGTAGVLGIGAIALMVWFFLIIPQITNSHEVFEVTAENIGFIQLADEVGGDLSEPIKMVFVWNGDVIEDNGNQLLIHTVYDYKDILTGESLWVTEFDESVDQITRNYLDKSGHYMFPSNLQQQDYQVYDVGGAVMDYEFIGTSTIEDLTVYEFSGKTTFDISDVYPDFEEQIFEDYSATNFIEPVTGIEVSFTEKFTDYAIIDGQKVVILDAWDEPSPFSQKTHVQKANSIKTLHKFYSDVVPILIIIIIASTTIMFFLQSKFKKSVIYAKELQEMDKQKDEFVAMISHELKTPIVPLQLYTEMLLKGSLGPLGDKQTKALQTIHNSITSITELVYDMLDITKLELGRLTLHKKSINIQDLLTENIESLNIFTKEKNVTLELDAKVSGTIFCDPKRINQIISNLVKNSIDFVPENTGLIKITVEKNAKSFIFTVADNGPGIPVENQKHLFQKFYKIDTSSTRKHGGTGLGLTICHGIVKSHGGIIFLDTKYNQGTSFKFTIPMVKS
jgi:signal transduction histidine kinase